MIEEIRNIDLVINLKQSFGLNSFKPEVDDELLASCIRRQAGFQCPCSKITLVSSVSQSFQHLIEIPIEEFIVRLEEIVEKLIIGGDLLELNEVATNDLAAKGTWIFPAHPSYLPRPNGRFLIFGIVPDEISPIASLAHRIIYAGCKRTINQNEGEDLDHILSDLGLTKISESAWLKLPKISSAQDYLLAMNKKLSNATQSGEISELVILDGKKSNIYYRGRWTNPTNQTGNYVGKRPHLYGGIIWCYVELKDGHLVRFIDIPFRHNSINQRGCDGAWQLQMAIDYCAGNPQLYDIREDVNGDIFDFFSPIPLWAERRFIALGEMVESKNCLFSYLIPKSDSQSEERFIKENLWLSRKQ
ncbi:MAG: hypothetical protein BGO54_16745 [Sphingobacteriales bacterium 46-32]|nr:MAG: hypothetical protein BGO54_16745 [Sphingobacteriales bacterium 46-32]